MFLLSENKEGGRGKGEETSLVHLLALKGIEMEEMGWLLKLKHVRSIRLSLFDDTNHSEW